MGLSLNTLHILGIRTEDARGMLRAGDALYSENSPWLSILPEEPAFEASLRLSVVARKCGLPCLLFSCLDGDFFHVNLYLNGKLAGSFQSLGGTSKLSAFAAVLDGGDYRNLKLLAKCVDFDEALALAEELLGLRLLIAPGEAPDRVMRGDTIAQRIRAREKAVRSRPNRYRLAPLPRQEWPLEIEGRMRALEAMQGRSFSRSALLQGVSGDYWAGARRGESFACSCMDAQAPKRPCIRILNAADGSLRTIHPQLDCAPVAMLNEAQLPILCGFGASGRTDSVACLRKDGSILWRFRPEMQAHSFIDIYPEPEDNSLLAFSLFGGESTPLWRLSADDGRILAQCTLPAREDLRCLRLWRERDCYVYYSPVRRVFCLLDRQLRPAGEIPAGDAPQRWDFGAHACGGILLRQDSAGILHRFDLESGTQTRIRTELPGHLLAAFPDGRSALTNGSGKTILLHDAQGALLARLRVKGCAAAILHRGSESLLAETDLEAPDDAPPEALLRLWRIEET